MFKRNRDLQASANLAVDDFAFNNLFSVKKMRVQGEVTNLGNYTKFANCNRWTIYAVVSVRL